MAIKDRAVLTNLNSAINRPFKKDVDTSTLLTSSGRRNASFNRLIFMEAKSQDNRVNINTDGSYSVDQTGFDLKSGKKGMEAFMDYYGQSSGLMFNINPRFIDITYKKDVFDKAMANSKLQCPKTFAPLNRGVQFYGNETTVMNIKGYTGIPEKDSMIMTLMALGSFGYKWWTYPEGSTTNYFPDLAGYDVAPDSASIFGKTAPIFKRIGFLPIRWVIYYCACDTLRPFEEGDLINYGKGANDPWQSMQTKERVQLPRKYYGRIVNLDFTHEYKSANELYYEMVLHIDKFDENVGMGGNYINGL